MRGKDTDCMLEVGVLGIVFGNTCDKLFGLFGLVILLDLCFELKLIVDSLL